MGLLKKLKILYYANKLYKKIKEGIEMKKFFEREFILTIIGIIAALWGSLQGVISVDLSAKIAAGLVMVFALSRAIVKFTPTTKDDEMLKKIEAMFKKK